MGISKRHLQALITMKLFDSEEGLLGEPRSEGGEKKTTNFKMMP
jgi:hypothetical protein